MGWGTFIAGQAIGNVRRAGRKRSSSIDWQGIADELNERQVVFETEVLREIKRLQAEGKEVDIKAVRADMRRLRRAYRALGSSLDLMIVRKIQEKTLLGEPIDKYKIEREIVDAYKPFPWGKVLLWIFFPYVPIMQLILEKRKPT